MLGYADMKELEDLIFLILRNKEEGGMYTSEVAFCVKAITGKEISVRRVRNNMNSLCTHHYLKRDPEGGPRKGKRRKYMLVEESE